MNVNKESELSDIISDYAASLPGKIASIQESWKKLDKNWEAVTLKDLHNRVHSLHGSAGMFGYNDMSEIAGQLELIIDAGFNKEFTEKQKTQINALLEELKIKSESKITTSNLSLPESKDNKTEINNEIFMLNVSDTITNTNLNWVTETEKKLKVFGYILTNFKTFETLEESLKKSLPFAFLVNLNLLDDDTEKRFIEIKNKYFPHIPLLYFAKSGDFSLRIKAVKLEGKAFFVLPFNIDNVIYEFDRIRKLENETYQAVIIDDEIEVANYHAAILSKAHFNCKVVTKAEQLDKVLHDFKPDVILMDFYMPECTGFELASLVRQQREYEFTPIIFLSSEEDRSKQLNAMTIGVDDFITKKTPPEYLIMTVKNKAYRYKMLQSMTTKDNLTVALNERAILKTLETTLSEAQTVSETVSIAIIKITNLEKIINEFGNQAGDQVLKALSLMLRARTRVFDLIGVYNNKFLLVMPHTDLETAKALVKELQAQFILLTYYHKNQIFNATFTAGLASTKTGYDCKGLLQQADQALLQSPVKSL